MAYGNRESFAFGFGGTLSTQRPPRGPRTAELGPTLESLAVPEYEAPRIERRAGSAAQGPAVARRGPYGSSGGHAHGHQDRKPLTHVCRRTDKGAQSSARTGT